MSNLPLYRARSHPVSCTLPCFLGPSKSFLSVLDSYSRMSFSRTGRSMRLMFHRVTLRGKKRNGLATGRRRAGR